MTVDFPERHLTRDELWAEAAERFGTDHINWAFQCPMCRDIATGADVRNALEERPREHPTGHWREGRLVEWTDVLGQECIGRILSEPEEPLVRGCRYVAFGLFPGPWQVTLPYYDGPRPCFPLAPALELGGGESGSDCA
ncbi:VVA0879 family protein [Streptomyces sp. NPDC052207]|uniref:VVA0879 family protein n=1 Tax=Streptomyces sp. NPDC052207 TaxID=3155418 RepID=UPI003418A538